MLIVYHSLPLSEVSQQKRTLITDIYNIFNIKAMENVKEHLEIRLKRQLNRRDVEEGLCSLFTSGVNWIKF